MTRSELIERIAEKFPQKTSQEVEQLVTTIFAEISGALQRGDRVELRGFGSFFVRKREGRTGCDPRSGKAIKVDERYVPLFRAGKILLEKMN